jgi:hypothetical protein
MHYESTWRQYRFVCVLGFHCSISVDRYVKYAMKCVSFHIRVLVVTDRESNFLLPPGIIRNIQVQRGTGRRQHTYHHDNDNLSFSVLPNCASHVTRDSRVLLSPHVAFSPQKKNCRPRRSNTNISTIVASKVIDFCFCIVAQ